MSWQCYVDSLMADGTLLDCAIVGYCTKSIWAAYEGGYFQHLEPAEIEALIGQDRKSFFTNGLTLASRKCSVLRDLLLNDDDYTMDLRTKVAGGGKTCGNTNVCVGKSKTALLLLMGKEGIGGGILNKKAHTMAEYLRNCGC